MTAAETSGFTPVMEPCPGSLAPARCSTARSLRAQCHCCAVFFDVVAHPDGGPGGVLPEHVRWRVEGATP